MRRGTRSSLLFFVLGFSTCLVLLALVRCFTHVDLKEPIQPVLSVKSAVEEKKEAPSYKIGACPDCKKISQKYWKVDKLNDDNNIHLEAAHRMGITPFLTTASFNVQKDNMVRAKRLVCIFDSKSYHLKDLTHSFPYLVPPAVRLLNEIGARFESKLDSMQIAPHLLQISSVLRTVESQNGLGKRNTNAATESAHMYGTTFDISYKEFIAVNGKKVKEGYCRHDLMRHVLGEVLTEMRSEGRCKVVIERKQACFHITVSN